MDNFVSTIAVLALAAVIVLLFLKVLRPLNRDAGGSGGARTGFGGTKLTTAEFFVYTITEAGTAVGRTKPITDVPPEGVTIGCYGSTGATIALEKTEVSDTVSYIHMRLLKDSATGAYYVERYDNKSQMFDRDGNPIEKAEINPIDGTVIGAGKQWIYICSGNKHSRFRGNINFGAASTRKTEVRNNRQASPVPVKSRPPFRGGDYYT